MRFSGYMGMCVSVLWVSVLWVTGILAQDAEPIEMVLHPREIESPVLKYRLLPSELERKEGNAVPILLRLPWEQTQWMTTVYPKLEEWEQRPLTAPEWANSGGVLPHNFYHEMKRAAYRREASWEYPIQETQSLYMILLPDVQGLRAFLGRGLSGRIRYHLSQGELEQAREGILVGFANARHIAQTPFFVNQLVAISIHRIMLERTRELIAQPGSPNLYWALSTLPASLIEMDRAASLESEAFAACLPAVTDLDRPRDEKEWIKMADQLVELLNQLGELPPKPPAAPGASVVEKLLQSIVGEKNRLLVTVRYAREKLPGQVNISSEAVSEMSDTEVVVRWYVFMRQSVDHLAGAALVLPPREAWPQLKAAEEERNMLHHELGANKSPGFKSEANFYVASWTLRQRIASLRIIEAVRHFLATNDGKLPATLEDIKDLPIPLDPLTDRPFEWIVDQNTAILKSPPLPPIAQGLRPISEKSPRLEYRLTVK